MADFGFSGALGSGSNQRLGSKVKLNKPTKAEQMD